MSARKRGAAVALLVLVALLIWWWRRGSAAHPRPKPTAEASPPAPPSDPPRRWVKPALPPPAPPPAHNRPPPLEPIIDSVTVEKPEVCSGEENLVTVKAHTKDGVDDAFLHYFIVDDVGAMAPLRLATRDDEVKRHIQRKVIVFGRYSVSTSVDLPPYRVKDCKPKRKLFIIKRLMPNTEGTFELFAQINDITAAQPMKPTGYHWDFGDGSSADSDGPRVEHDFNHRPQDTMYSQLLVSCTATSKDETLLGRTGLQLMNVAFEELEERGAVKLFIDLEPRFPVMAPDGVVTQHVHIWHHRKQPVVITSLTTAKTPRFAPGAPPPTESPEQVAVDVTSILGTDTIPPEGITTTVYLDTHKDPDIAFIDYLLEGRSAEGYVVHGNFSVMRPPELPTKDTAEIVYSPLQTAEILRARELLGKPYVTGDELMNLQRDGKFADLEADPKLKLPADFKPPPPKHPVHPPTPDDLQSLPEPTPIK